MNFYLIQKCLIFVNMQRVSDLWYKREENIIIDFVNLKIYSLLTFFNCVLVWDHLRSHGRTSQICQEEKKP